MRKSFKTTAAMLMSLGVLTTAKAASAGGHGVVFIHGTGDSPGTVTNSGSNAYVPAAQSYWNAGEVASVAGSHPYIIVGFNGGSCAPWPQSGDSTYGKTSTGSSCPLASTTGNSDVITSQIHTWMTANNITDIVLVTHSGGSNQARYILNNYTRNSDYTAVKNATKRVITSAGTTKGTYLANEVYSGGIAGTVIGFIAGLVGYGGEGVNLLRTNYISTYNSSSSYLGAVQNPLNGVNFYETGGTATTIGCVGVKIWGVCVGVSNVRSLDGDATPLTACDSVLMDTGLLVLHDSFLDANDPSTMRTSGCSDGFISCMSSQALGNTFGFSAGHDHNQSRRQCGGVDSNIRAYVNSAESGFDMAGEYAGGTAVNPHQIDACGFGTYAAIKNGSTTVAWTEGCTTAQLGNGNCDWDCVALYGNDAVVTSWDSTGKKPLTWGASDCTGTAAGYAGLTTSTNPFGESGTYQNTSGGTVYNTAFNGYTCTGTAAQCGGYTPSSYQWFYDPNYVATGALINDGEIGYCPQSWIGDGTCDECVVALYGSDGTDCLPGRIVQCGGIVTAAQPYQGSSYYYYNNAIYNESLPSSGGSTWLEWQAMSASSGDGVCENTECASGTANAIVPAGANAADSTGRMPCTTGATCPGMLNCGTQVAGYCDLCTTGTNNATHSCNSTTYGWSGNTCNVTTGLCYQTATLSSACNSNADCLSGTCVGGGCTTSSADCSTSYAVAASTYACTTNSDCTNYGGTCSGGFCTGTITTSLCR